MVSLDSLSHSTTPFCPPPVTTSAIACRPTFAVLPEEIIVKILEWCDFKGVLACQRVRATSCLLSVDPANDDMSTTLLPSL
jgi:F-box domain